MQPGGSGARTAAGAPYTMAGKTGTAQVVSRRGSAAVDPRSLPMHLRHRALFVGFAPAENPQIAVAVAVEGGGYGGTSAGPIARKVFDAWLLGKPVAPKQQDEATPVDAAVQAALPPDFSDVQGSPGMATPTTAPTAARR